MRKLSVLIMAGCLVCLVCLVCLSGYTARLAVKESKFNQVVNDVRVISTADSASHPATADGFFKQSEVLRTGPASRAELLDDDRTVTRVGANTTFSFDGSSRGVHLEQGSLLMESPKGKGENSIHTRCSHHRGPRRHGHRHRNHRKWRGPKYWCWKAWRTFDVLLRGGHQRLHAGEMMIAQPDGIPGQISNFRLDQLVANSKLVSGFAQSLPSLSRINVQIARQLHQIQIGQAQDVTNAVPVINPIEEINGGFIPSQLAGIKLPAPWPFPGTSLRHSGQPFPPVPPLPSYLQPKVHVLLAPPYSARHRPHSPGQPFLHSLLPIPLPAIAGSHHRHYVANLTYRAQYKPGTIVPSLCCRLRPSACLPAQPRRQPHYCSVSVVPGDLNFIRNAAYQGIWDHSRRGRGHRRPPSLTEFTRGCLVDAFQHPINPVHPVNSPLSKFGHPQKVTLYILFRIKLC